MDQSISQLIKVQTTITQDGSRGQWATQNIMIISWKILVRVQPISLCGTCRISHCNLQDYYTGYPHKIVISLLNWIFDDLKASCIL